MIWPMKTIERMTNEETEKAISDFIQQRIKANFDAELERVFDESGQLRDDYISPYQQRYLLVSQAVNTEAWDVMGETELFCPACGEKQVSIFHYPTEQVHVCRSCKCMFSIDKIYNSCR